MTSSILILFMAFGYLLLLFAVAYFADKRAEQGKSLIDNPYVYALSLAVYCTAWTFYGSVGRASETGLGFLPIYIGPTLMAALWWIVLRKMIYIAKHQRITSIADFISSRYGKSTSLAGIVSVIAVLGIIPYISLQLKAVSISYQVLQASGGATTLLSDTPFFTDTAFYVAVLMGAFTILFGTRHLDTSEKHEGLVAAIAVESLVKLFAFFAVGLFVVFFVYDSPVALFQAAYASTETSNLLNLGGSDVLRNDWIWLTLLSMPAILLLPRQFQTAVVENVRVEHVRKAAWMFPLYLLLINLFVLPIALAGLLHPSVSSMDADTFVLTIPLAEGNTLLALFVFIGGLSAATSMVIVATIALSTMVSNDLVMPVILRSRNLNLFENQTPARFILFIRRVSIMMILLGAYLYFRFIGEDYTLVSIGLVSFAAIAQFTPAFFIGLYWRGATKAGATVGILSGILIWAYTLVIPSLAGISESLTNLVLYGPWGLEFLKPDQLFGITGFSPVAQAVFWSLLINIVLFLLISIYSKQSAEEIKQAALFVDGKSSDSARPIFSEGSVTVGKLQSILQRFLGNYKGKRVINDFFKEVKMTFNEETAAPPQLIQRTEAQLTGIIGSASASLILRTELQERPLRTEDVREILDETRQVLEYSRKLEEKSKRLEEASAQLKEANKRLKELDEMKDEFIATVSHELKTPLTSIRALTEIMHDSSDIAPENRQRFLSVMLKESERLSRLINQLLDSQKAHSGKLELNKEEFDLAPLISDNIASIDEQAKKGGIKISLKLPDNLPIVFGDRDRLQQVLLNLLSNALKYTDSENGIIEIKVEASTSDIKIHVTDNGNGIKEEDLNGLFEAFVQVGEKSERKSGTGLGLYISRKIMEAHDGKLTVQSSIGKGSSFTMHLPV